MPWEMLSGPDLGGGFLFQLTVEPLDTRARLIYHAQEGGIDASGPPKGSPVPFGFFRTTASCEIGGRDCYHRVFVLSAEEVPKARMAYNRLRFVTAPMLEQQYGGADVPIRAAAEEVAKRLAPAFADRPDRWFFAGSAAAWLQDAPGSPRTIELGTDADGLAQIANALSDYLVEPLAETTWRELGPVRGARAYVGTLRSGVRVEWARLPAGVGPRAADMGADPDDVVTAELKLGEGTVRASRPEYGLVHAAVRGDRGEESAIGGLLRARTADRALLDRLLAASDLPPPDQARVRASAGTVPAASAR
jgi:hypothetical protein